MTQTTQPTLISVFSGAGGLDLGLHSAGYELRLALEIDETCRRTLSRNFQCPFATKSDILQCVPADLLEEACLASGELDLLAGGPPCQPFSKAAQWVDGEIRGIQDERASTIDSLFDIVEVALPKVILIENVEGIAARSKNSAVANMENRLRAINQKFGTAYSPQIIKLNAANYGVPQTRIRVFFLAQRDGLRLKVPKAKYSDGGRNSLVPDGEIEQLTEPMTSWDAIGDLEHETFGEELMLRGKWSQLVPTIPEGENYLWHTPRGGGEPIFGWRTRYWSFLLKLSKRRPSWTIAAQPGPSTGPLHWTNRYLSTRELARLQSFPDDFIFDGSFLERRKQIGNAVPPLLAEVLGVAINEQFLGNKCSGDLKLLTDVGMRVMPDPHPVEPIPRSFLEGAEWGLVKDHPGTGKGPRAKMRML